MKDARGLGSLSGGDDYGVQFKKTECLVRWKKSMCYSFLIQ